MYDESIRTRLLELEHRTPEFEERFIGEMKAMTEQKLTMSQKLQWLVSIAFSVGMIVMFGYKALAPDRPLMIRMGYIEALIFAAVFLVLGIMTLSKGSFNIYRQEKTIQLAVLMFILLTVINLMILGGNHSDKIQGLQMMIYGAFFFMVFGIPAIITMRISRTESTLREQTLKLELRVAELAEKIGEKR